MQSLVVGAHRKRNHSTTINGSWLQLLFFPGNEWQEKDELMLTVYCCGVFLGRTIPSTAGLMMVHFVPTSKVQLANAGAGWLAGWCCPPSEF